MCWIVDTVEREKSCRMEAQLVDVMFAVRPRKTRNVGAVLLYGEVERFERWLRQFGLCYRVEAACFVFEVRSC